MPRAQTIESLVADVIFIGERLKELVFADEVFWQTNAILKAHVRDPESVHFANWMEQGYVAMLCTGLRAVGDATSGARSLLKVFEGIIRLRAQLTRSRFLSLDDRLDRDILSRAFDNLAGRGNDLIPEQPLQERRSQLKAGLKRVQIYANNFITHWGDSSQSPPTFTEVRDALKLSTELHSYASEVLTGTSIMYPDEVIWSNWTRVFRVPWLPKQHPVPPFRSFARTVTDGSG